MMCVTGIPLHKSSKKQKVKHTNDAPKLNLVCSNVSSLAGPDLSVRPWAGSLLEAPTQPQML